MSDPEIFSKTNLGVRFHECESLKVLWQKKYLNYWKKASYEDPKNQYNLTPLVKFLGEHKLPLRYHNGFEVKTWLISSQVEKMHFKGKILKDNNIVCTGETHQVFDNNSPANILGWKHNTALLK